MKSMEAQDTKCIGRVTCTSEVGHAAPIRENKNAHRIVVGKTEGKKPPGISRCKWGDNIKICFKEIKWRAWTGFIWLRIEISSGGFL